MKNYKLLINILITLIIFNFVKADDEESATEAVEAPILTPGPITGVYKKKDLDDSYDEESSSIIKCSGSTCSSENEEILLEEGKITISNAGTYILKGNLNGQLDISTTKEDFIHLILDNMDITSDNGPALYVNKCDKIVITTIGKNSLTDSTNYTVDEDEEPDACLFVKGDLTFNGNGSLNITGNYKEGIRCKKDLKFVSGTVDVKAVEKAIKAKNSVSVKEATINVDAVDTGIKVTKDDDPEKGFIVIDGGKITVKSGNDGLHAETHLTINDGYIDVTESKEGIEGQMVDILGGEIHVIASDDGINASKIGSVNDQFGPPGGFPGNFNGTMGGPGGFPGNDFNGSMGKNGPEGFPGNFPIEDSEEEEISTTTTIKNPPKPTTTPTRRRCIVKFKNSKKIVKTTTTIVESNLFSDDENKKEKIELRKRAEPKEEEEDDDQVYINIIGGEVHVKVDGGDVDGIDANGKLYIGGEAKVFVTNGSGDIYGNMAALDADSSNIIDKGATVVATASGMSRGGPGNSNGPNGPNGSNGPNSQDGRGPRNQNDQNQHSNNSNKSNENSENQNFPNMPNMPMFNNTNNPFGDHGHESDDKKKPDGKGPGGAGGPHSEEGIIKQANIQTTIESQESGTELIVKDSKGKVIISHKPNSVYSKILITTPKLVAGKNYTIIAGTETVTVTATIDSNN